MCVLLYAALLRLDALFQTYGPYSQPRWLAALQEPVRTAAATLTPDWRWARDPDPYVGGDPINYLKFAREMRHFYQAHSREPMFVAATRLGLLASHDHDVGVSLTSIGFSLLALVATYLLGAQLASPAVGLCAAAALAIDRSAVWWAIGGWRDDIFAFFAVLSTWAWVRLYREKTYSSAILAGVVSAGACLTRITSFALIAPAILWLVLAPDPGGRMRRQASIAAAIMFALVAPFLINCAIATGDPLFAINNHTDFYLKREGMPEPPKISAIAYTLQKFERPLAAADTMVTGIFAYPFNNKWVGLDHWRPGLGRVLAWLALGGMFAWLWQREGRLVLVMFLSSLIPFSATWTVRGGAEWRLTLFAYSFYLVAGFWLLDRAARHARDWRAAFDRRALRPLGAGLAIILLAAAWTWGMPYAIVRESIARGEAAIIRAGGRDRMFLADGWSDLVVTGNVTARFATKPSATIRVPLPERRLYKVLMRIDPLYYPGALPQRVQVDLNGKPFTVLSLAWNPERVGEYELTIPASAVDVGPNILTLHSERMTPIGRAGDAYREIPRDREVGVRLWYVLLTPA
jgi:hypothetical protein